MNRLAQANRMLKEKGLTKLVSHIPRKISIKIQNAVNTNELTRQDDLDTQIEVFSKLTTPYIPKEIIAKAFYTVERI